jgi:hypothetical protein
VPVPLDEFPAHQLPVSFAQVGTTDRNFYDRSYFNAYGTASQTLLLTGLGVYPNLGVTDAYATVRRGDTQWAVRFSDALTDDRLNPRVGGYRIEVLEPLKRLRLVCDGDAHGLGFDLTWEGTFPAVDEPPHVVRSGRRTTIDASRFAQLGTWSGTLRVAGDEIAVDPSSWVGVRDRSWGIRPVGESVPPGRGPEKRFEGFWWVFLTVKFDEYAVIVVLQEEPDGFRTQDHAVRVWPDGRQEHLGSADVTIAYAPGTRHPERARVVLHPHGAPQLTLELDTTTAIALHVGAGYGTDPDWRHGLWKGADHASGSVYDLTDPTIQARIPTGVIDHACRAVCDGAVGWGLFEHGTVGRHDPSGFADMTSLA